MEIRRPTFEPVPLVVSWHGIPPLPAEWEAGFWDAAGRLRLEGIVVQPPHPRLPGPAMLVTAYLASRQGDPLVSQTIGEMQQEQMATPAIRLCLVACGGSAEEVNEDDVRDLLCSDNASQRRHPVRAVEIEDLVARLGDWIRVDAMEHAARSSVPAASTRRYDSESLIAAESEGGEDLWPLGY